MQRHLWTKIANYSSTKTHIVVWRPFEGRITKISEQTRINFTRDVISYLIPIKKYLFCFYLTSILFAGEPANHAKKHWKIFVHVLSQVTTYCHNYFYVQKEPILIEKFWSNSKSGLLPPGSPYNPFSFGTRAPKELIPLPGLTIKLMVTSSRFGIFWPTL